MGVLIRKTYIWLWYGAFAFWLGFCFEFGGVMFWNIPHGLGVG